MLSASDFFQWETTSLAALFEGTVYVWEVLQQINPWLEKQLQSLPSPDTRQQGLIQPGAFVAKDVILAPGSVVEPGAYIKGPTYVGVDSVIRHGAYLREGSIIGEHCIVGHASEVKTSILLDGSAAPHFNYVGNSILGQHCNLGAGVKLSNVKHTKTEIIIKSQDRDYPTGLTKFGAILGDRVALGCNSVCNPGTLIGPGTLVYPNASLRGIYPAHCIIKTTTNTKMAPRNV
jgi:NDP-sugar pyrophosphorylase family protein